MRTTVLALLCAAGALLGQTPTKKSDLETLLDDAFKHNPDLKVAEAKLIEAQAELSRARLALAHKVLVAHAEMSAAQKMYDEATRRWERDKTLLAKSPGAISRDDLEISQTTTFRYKAAYEAAQAKMNQLVGKLGEPEKAALFRLEAVRLREVAVRGGMPTAAKEVPPGKVVGGLLKALETEMEVDFSESDPKDFDVYFMLVNIAKRHKLDIVGMRATLGIDSLPLKVPPTGGRTTLAALLTFFEDDNDIVFLVREYGLVAVPKDKVPPGALTLREFRKMSAK